MTATSPLFDATASRFGSSRELVAALRPAEPVYCLYPHVLERTARAFLSGFPGHVLYAVKANPVPRVLQCLHAAGVRHFDTASVPEIELVSGLAPDASCYFMAPIKLRGAAGEAYTRFGVRDFVVDHENELDYLLESVPARDIRIFARLETHAADATYDLSTKFGATAREAARLLRGIEASGARPALSFNVGSLVMRPRAYEDALEECRGVIAEAGVEISAIDVGGGFPSAYPGLDMPALETFFAAITAARESLGLPAAVELLGEPGRALVADGVTLVTQVLLRKDSRLYVNDGIYGSLSEPAISRGKVTFPTRVLRSGGEVQDSTQRFTLYGPTCDSLDVLPVPFDLPADLRAGDWIEFGMLGAYGQAMRTRFNGFYPERMIDIDDPAALPPGEEG